MAADISDDYYMLLGIDAGTDDVELRRAWRRLAVQWHPDRAGPDATATFQKISVAYAVLSDPIARAAYDRRRGTARGARTPSDDVTSAPAAHDRRHDTTARSARTPSGDVTGAPAAAERRRAPGVMLSRLSRPLNVLLVCGIARRAEDEIIELLLNSQEATQGGMVTIPMRVLVHCPACVMDAVGACARCGTARTIDELFSAWLAVPPDVAEGTILIPSAQLRGVVRPVSFRVRLPATARQVQK